MMAVCYTYTECMNKRIGRYIHTLYKGKRGSHFYSSLLAPNMASFISISVLPTQMLKLHHMLGFIIGFLLFSVD